MKFSTEVRKIEGLDSFAPIEHSIKRENMGVIMSILTRQLYADKIGSIIRELVCNALDAHIAAGKANTPIQITMPTEICPEFVVRDFGHGMDKEFMEQRYTSLGDSSKRESNDQTGMFGLGRLSPFCYTDAFTVATTYEGVTRHYTLQINSTGNTLSVPLGEVANGTPNGTSVTIAVPSKDIQAFRKKIIQFTRFLSVQPEFLNGEGNVCLDVQYSGDVWYILQQINGSYGSKENHFSTAHALMGNVAYPLSYNALNISDDTLRSIINCPNLVIKFDIGELSVSPSRESLSYDRNTIVSISNKLKIVAEDIQKIIGTNLERFPNIIEAIKFVSDMIRTFSFLNTKMGDLTYKGVKLYTKIERYVDADTFDYNDTKTYMSFIGYRVRNTRLQEVNFSSVGVFDNTVLVIDNGESRMKSRIRAMRNDPKFAKCQTFILLDKAHPLFATLWTHYGFEYYPDNMLVSASAYDPIKIVRSGGSGVEGRASVPLFELQQGAYSNSARDYWADTTFEKADELETKYYLPIRNYKPSFIDVNTDWFDSLSKTAKALKIMPQTVFGVRVADTDDLDESWERADEYLLSKAMELYNAIPTDLLDKCFQYYHAETDQSEYNWLLSYVNKSELSAKNPININVDAGDVNTLIDRLRKILELLRLLQRSTEAEQISSKIKENSPVADAMEKILEKLPMLKLLQYASLYSISNAREIITNHLKTLDNYGSIV